MDQLITAIIAVAKAVPIVDKWLEDLTKAYNKFKLDQAEQKARKESNTEDLQKELGKDK